MEPQKAGKIINIASVAGIGGFSAFHPSYCANAIAAGGILTPPMEAYLSKCSEEPADAIPGYNSPASSRLFKKC
jgi:hypothetical protein